MKFGESLANQLRYTKILLLDGPLGAGKTSLVKGIGKGLGINEPITSPTFALAHHYLTGTRALLHLDLYRLEDETAANALFIEEEEISNELNGLIVIEWPSRLNLLINDACRMRISYLSNEGREVELISSSKDSKNVCTSEQLG